MPFPKAGAQPGRQRLLTLVLVLLATLSLVIPAGTLAAKPANTPPHAVNVQLLAINDFHGNLEPPSGSSGRVGSAADDAACIASPRWTVQSPGSVSWWRAGSAWTAKTVPGDAAMVRVTE